MCPTVPPKQWRPVRIPQRVVLAVLSFFGFFINYMLRVNINIAIVEMVLAPPLDANHTLGEGGCLVQQDNLTVAASNLSIPTSQAGGEFDWDVHEQGQVLGSFYWSYVISLIPGAMLADKLGTKMVFGGANLVSVLVALLTPVAARFHYRALLFARIMQGLVSGVTWPAMHVMVSRWIPPHERSKFVTTYYGNYHGSTG
uniref:Major facilitator superfamily (MFS) profile domain-containing protein n=1 Tax=Timema douglasi TaxID=61478 RepID=A0A7R8ZG61_TIMDO|nr:unnamed protein product [Timema douglasi]